MEKDCISGEVAGLTKLKKTQSKGLGDEAEIESVCDIFTMTFHENI